MNQINHEFRISDSTPGEDRPAQTATAPAASFESDEWFLRAEKAYYEYTAAANQAGSDDLCDAYTEKATEVSRAIADRPAATMTDVRVKLRLMSEWDSNLEKLMLGKKQPKSIVDKLYMSALNDAETLRGAGPNADDNTLAALIEKHRRTYEAFTAAADLEGTLYNAVHNTVPPEVVLSRNHDTKVPMYAIDEEHINSFFDRLPVDLFPNRERNRAYKLEEFRAWLRRRKDAAAASGALAAEQKANALEVEAGDAFDALCAYTPRNFAEVTMLAAHLVQFHKDYDLGSEYLFVEMIESWAKAGALA